MEAKELMLDDLVIYRGEIYHVAGTDRLGGLVVIDNEDGIELIHESEIEPILLIAEILEKNGWKYMKESELILAPKSGGFVKYKTDTHFVSISGDGVCRKNIGYVHELQHALRLCGLDELADNLIL